MATSKEVFKERLSQKRRAYHLFIVKGYSQKEAAKLVGISEKTFGAWAKKYKWKEITERKLLRTGGVEELMSDFIIFIDLTKPDISEDVRELWNEFLSSLKEE